MTDGRQEPTLTQRFWNAFMWVSFVGAIFAGHFGQFDRATFAMVTACFAHLRAAALSHETDGGNQT